MHFAQQKRTYAFLAAGPGRRYSGSLLGACCLLIPLVAWTNRTHAVHPESPAVHPESPAVRQLIEDGKRFLEQQTDSRLGGKCLIALAFLKDGAPLEHPRIQEALTACQELTAEQILRTDVYSNGLAIIFLAELADGQRQDLIQRYARAMAARQKPNGAWGYPHSQQGDTSQTQYAALALWELLQVGQVPQVETIDACVQWLLNTQDPSGAWGYQGREAADAELIPQAKTSLSMMAAGLGSTLILGNMLDVYAPQNDQQPGTAPSDHPALRRVGAPARRRVIPGTTIDREKLQAAVTRAQAWYDQNFSPQALAQWQTYPCYLLYSLERYKSFEELLTGHIEAGWYQAGYQFLQEHQQHHGGWKSHAQDPCATAFAILFLLRSTQKSIQANLGPGTLVGGRGLHADLSKMKLRSGRLVTEQAQIGMDQLLHLLEATSSEDLETLLESNTEYQAAESEPAEVQRLQQIVRGGSPAARVLAVRALARLRNLDYVPWLLHALTDPDRRVVREARDGLRLVSRRFGGFGLPDNFDDSQRYRAIDHWQNWYQRLRPQAVLAP